MRNYTKHILTVWEIRNLHPKSLRKFRKQKLTIDQIAERCGIAQSVISKRLREYKIK